MYIYRLEAGYDKKPPEVKEFFYAPNAKRLIQYAQTMYRDKKYNMFKPVKVGVTKEPEQMRLIGDFEAWYLRQNMTAEFYSERIDP
jgi:hypothetical protein